MVIQPTNIVPKSALKQIRNTKQGRRSVYQEITNDVQHTCADSQQPHHQQIQHALPISKSTHAGLYFQDTFEKLLLHPLPSIYTMIQRKPWNKIDKWHGKKKALVVENHSRYITKTSHTFFSWWFIARYINKKGAWKIWTYFSLLFGSWDDLSALHNHCHATKEKKEKDKKLQNRARGINGMV